MANIGMPIDKGRIIFNLCDYSTKLSIYLKIVEF